MQNEYLNKIWHNHIGFNWILGLILILVVGIPRFVIVMKAYVSGNFYYIFLVFLTLWFLPFLFLSKKGLRFIGFKKAERRFYLPLALLAGVTMSVIVFLVGEWFYGDTISNWFVYISRSNGASGTPNESERLIFFLISGAMSMTFSPVGEELFYRGLIHGAFQVDFGQIKASYIDSLAFALTHLAHFGIVYNNQTWSLLFLPALLWVLFMFLASRVFFFFKQKSGSLAGAILCHAGFNVAMMYFIFYYIL